jgi:hypothetical protein
MGGRLPKEAAAEEGKKKKAEADGPSNPNPPPTTPTQAGYTQSPLGLPLGLGNFMYPATVPGMGLGSLGLNSPNIILQTWRPANKYKESYALQQLQEMGWQMD